MRWGIYDTEDHCWLGDDNGPKLFDGPNAEILSRVSAQITGVQMQYEPNRLQHKKFHEGPVLLKDEIPTPMTPVEALRRAMGTEHEDT